MTLGEKIQALRTDAGLSQEDLAEQLAVSRQAVSKWELDKTVPDVKYIVALSNLSGVTTDYLLKDDFQAAPPQAQTPAPPPPPISQGSDCPLTPPKSPDRSCLLMDASLCLFALLLFLYLANDCFRLSFIYDPLAAVGGSAGNPGDTIGRLQAFYHRRFPSTVPPGRGRLLYAVGLLHRAAVRVLRGH